MRCYAVRGGVFLGACAAILACGSSPTATTIGAVDGGVPAAADGAADVAAEIRRVCPDFSGRRTAGASLTLTWVMHVDPGGGNLGVEDPGTWDSEPGFQQIAMILAELGRVMERHEIPMVVATSGPYWRGHFAKWPERTARRTAKGDLTDLSARGHEIGLHQHNVTTLEEKVELHRLLLGDAYGPLHIEGDISRQAALPLGIRSIAGNKDVPTQAIDQNLTPYRPADEVYAVDADGPLVRVRHGYDTTKGFAPELTDFFRRLVCADLERLDTARLNNQAFVGHPDEYVYTRDVARRFKTRDEVRADAARLDAWLGETIDPLVSAGVVRWVTMRKLVDEYERWEVDAGRHANDDLFPSKVTIDAPGWSSLPVGGQGGLLGPWVREAAPLDGDLWFVHGRRNGGLSKVETGGQAPKVVEVISGAKSGGYRFGSDILTAATKGGEGELVVLAYAAPFGDPDGPKTTLSRYRPGTGAIVRDEAFDDLWSGGPRGFVFDLAAADGSIYVGTSRGLYRSAGDGWRRVSLGGATMAFHLHVRDGQDRWVGTYGGGLVRLGKDDRVLEVFTYASTGGGIPDDSVLAIEVDRDGVLWVGTARGAAYQDGSTFKPLPINATALQNDHVTALLADRLGNLWFGTYGGGVGRLGRDRSTWDWFTTANGALVGNYVFDITEDPTVDGRVYVSSYHGGGVSVHEPQR